MPFFVFMSYTISLAVILYLLNRLFLFADKAKIDILRLDIFNSCSLSLYLNPINLDEIKAPDLHDFCSWY